MLRFGWLPLALALSFTLSACTRHLPPEQRRECRQLRGRAAARGIFMVPVGAAALFLVALADVSGDGDEESERGEARRARRRHRREVCRDLQRPLAPMERVSEPATTEEPELAERLPAPDREALEAALRGVEPQLRACVPEGVELVTLDVALRGATGRVRGFDVDGLSAETARACVQPALREVRFDPFEGEVRVRWTLNLTDHELPAPWSGEPVD